MFKYSPHFLPNKIFLFGCGGTGSRIMPGLAQLVRSLLNKNNPLSPFLDLRILCCDGDIVEEKNLLRQHFAPQDVGKNKAAVLAARYSSAFGVDIHPCTNFFGEDRDLEFIGYPGDPYSGFCIIILAVDSAVARKKILSSFARRMTYTSNLKEMFLIDVGNEDSFGQIKYSNLVVANHASIPSIDFKVIPKLVPVTLDIPFIPFDSDYYMKLGGSAQELSCADLPQTLAVNNQAASLVITACQNFLLRKPFHNSGIRFSLDGSFYQEKLDSKWLRQFLARNNLVDKLSAKARTFHTKFAPIPALEVSYVEYLINIYPDVKYEFLFEALRTKCAAFYAEKGLQVLPDGELAPLAPPELTSISKEETPGIGTSSKPLRKKSPAGTNLESQPVAATPTPVPASPPPLVPI